MPKGTLNDGYGAISFDLKLPYSYAPGWAWLEIHTSPERLKVVYGSMSRNRTSRAEWYGSDAVSKGLAVIMGHMPPAILADYCDEVEPTRTDAGFPVGDILRSCITD